MRRIEEKFRLQAIKEERKKVIAEQIRKEHEEKRKQDAEIRRAKLEKNIIEQAAIIEERRIAMFQKNERIMK